MKKMQASDIEIIVRNVDRLVRNRQNMNRFREMVWRWYNTHTDKPEYELLPLSSRKHTLTEMYTVLAVIHDRYCGGMEQINPWPTSSLEVLSTDGIAYFDWISFVDRRLYDNDYCTLENYLHHVKADLEAQAVVKNESQPNNSCNAKAKTKELPKKISVDTANTPELNEAEQNIIEALHTETLTGEKLAKKAGYPYNSNFKSTLSSLRKRYILGNKAPGYFVQPQYHTLLKKSD